MGMALAVEKADSLGIAVELNVMDSQNKKEKISRTELMQPDWSGVQSSHWTVNSVKFRLCSSDYPH